MCETLDNVDNDDYDDNRLIEENNNFITRTH